MTAPYAENRSDRLVGQLVPMAPTKPSITSLFELIQAAAKFGYVVDLRSSPPLVAIAKPQVSFTLIDRNGNIVCQVASPDENILIQLVAVWLQQPKKET